MRKNRFSEYPRLKVCVFQYDIHGTFIRFTIGKAYETIFFIKPVGSFVFSYFFDITNIPPILSTRIFNELVNDLADNRDRFTEDKDLKRFLNAKYFKNLRQETLNDIFKKLWKLIFKIENEECDLNREINYRTLLIIYNLNIIEILKLIKSEESHFDGVKNGVCTEYLFDLLFESPKIYSSLSELNKAHLDYEIENSLDFRFLNWFMYSSITEFHEAIIESIKKGNAFYLSPKIYDKLKNLYKDFDIKTEFLDLSIAIFSKSNFFDTADQNFNQRIQPFLAEFSNDQLIDVVKAVNENGQIHNRGLARYSNRLIKTECENKLPSDFDYTIFKNFRL